MAITAPKLSRKKTARQTTQATSSSLANLSERWQQLPSRDQLALVLLGLFLLAVVGGYGGYKLHQSANEQQANYNQAIDEFFWLRGQAGNLSDSTDANAQPLPERLNQQLARAGVQSLQVLPAGEAVQISFTHDNQAVISNSLGSLVDSGLSLTQLNMTQNPTSGVITVQATVSE